MTTVGWVVGILAFLALLIALGLIFVPAIVTFSRYPIGVGVGLLACAILLLLSRARP